MRWIQIHFACLALPIGSGCGLIANGAHNAVNEPLLALSEWRFERKCRRLADDAWLKRADASNDFSDFRKGFLDGYADYLREGQTTEPLPVAPSRFRRLAYQTPESLQAANDYMAGFHEGAAAALASGDREQVVIPVSQSFCDKSARYDDCSMLPIKAPAHLPEPKNSDGERVQEPK